MSHIKQALLNCIRAGFVAAVSLCPLICEAANQPGVAGPANAYDAAIPIAYYTKTLEFTLTTAGFTPPVQSRAYAYMGIALYEAVRPGMPRYKSIANQLNRDFELPRTHGRPAHGDALGERAEGRGHPDARPKAPGHLHGPAGKHNSGYNWALAANAALAEVMRGLWGDATSNAAQNVAAINAMEATFEAEYSHVPPAVRDRSIEYGRAVGAAVYAGSLNDGGHQGYLTNFPPYTPPAGPGLWVPLPGQAALQPYWHVNVAPFVIPDASACAPGGPAPFSKDPASEFYAEALEVYDVGNRLTPDQRATAIFWADGPGTIWGTGHAMNIATQLLEQQGARLDMAAHLYAQTGIAQADSIIGCWYSKYTGNLVRPLSYINEVIDPTWKSALFPTPPFPEYTSAHSVQSAAVGRSLDAFYADVAFTDHSHDARGFAPRSYSDHWEAFEETSISRLYGGIHFSLGDLRGTRSGQVHRRPGSRSAVEAPEALEAPLRAVCER